MYSGQNSQWLKKRLSPVGGGHFQLYRFMAKISAIIMPNKQGTSGIAERSQSQFQSTNLKIFIMMKIITRLFVINHTVVDNISAECLWLFLFAMLLPKNNSVIESGNVIINQFQSTIPVTFIEIKSINAALVAFRIFSISSLLKLSFTASINAAIIDIKGAVTHLQFQSMMCVIFKIVHT